MTTTAPTAGGARPASAPARLLFLSANARDESPLSVDREYNRVTSELRDLGVWEAWHDAIEYLPAAEWEQVPELLLSQGPSIVHFAGHGFPDGSLLFAAPDGAGQRIHPEGLTALFKNFAGQVRLVVLNACYSHELAQAIGAHVDVVIGMPQAISDEAAILFAPTFYQQLAGGKSVQAAFEVASAVVLGKLPELRGTRKRDAELPDDGGPDLTPRMSVRTGVDAAQLTFAPAQPASAVPVPVPPVVHSRPPRHRGRTIAIAIAAAVVVLGTAGVWIVARFWPKPNPKPPPSVIDASTPRPSIVDARSAVVASEEALPRVSLDLVTIEAGALDGEPVPAFAIARTELTQAQWESLAARDPELPANPSTTAFGIGPQHPVANVAWDDALRAANAMSAQDQLTACYQLAGAHWTLTQPCRGYRLVTEREWRYLQSIPRRRDPSAPPCATANVADRSITERKPSLFADERAKNLSYAVLDCNDGQPLLEPVASRAADGLGIHQLDGNVAEWIWNGTAARPAGPAARGGSFLHPGRTPHLPPLDGVTANAVIAEIGVRLAKDVSP